MKMEQIAAKILGTLTISKKANRLVTGFDASKEAVLAAKADDILVLVSSDISPKTLKEVGFFCNRPNCPQVDIKRLPLSMEQLWAALGKKVAVLVLVDKGFSNKMRAILEQFPC